MWSQFMSLLCEQAVGQGSEVFQLATDGLRLHAKKQAKLLNLTPKQAKVVSEIYNPRRFGVETNRHGLLEGAAFDLILGHDLLKPGVRLEVRRHIQSTRPGLTIVSPPCTLFSIMQNMNQHHYEKPEKQGDHLRRLYEARVLLNFGVEVCQAVATYGGFFLFEHPWTSKAWEEPRLRRLLEKEGTFLARNDQCMFRLQSSRGIRHKKPTGWLTNHRGIAQVLNIQCDGSHDHDPVVGSGPGGSKSVLSQVYPPELVETVLKSYSRSLDEVYTLEQLLADLRVNAGRYHEIFSVGDDGGQPGPGGVDEMREGSGVPEQVEALRDGDIISVGDDEYIRRLPRERPFSVRQLVRRAHCGLGHVSNDRLVRILTQAKASPEVIKAARELVCPTCQKHQHVHPAHRGSYMRTRYWASIPCGYLV